jgi:hypothetical protein
MKNARSLILATISAGLGAVIGWGSFVVLTGSMATEDMKLGAWTTLNNIGEAQQSAYTRARVAIYGIWGLPPSEVIYFSAFNDDAGDALDPKCTYELRAPSPPARWWSVTAYRDGFYIDNNDDRYSLSQSTIKAQPNGDWQIKLSPDGSGENGLALGNQPGRIQLSYRLYQPQPGIADNRQKVVVPIIKKVVC